MSYKKIPICTGDFKKIRTESFLYVDKTLFIKEFIDSSSDVILIPRPRRFGKSTNMSTLKYYLDISEDSKKLFEGLYISKEKELEINYLNKFPVISLSLKNNNSVTFKGFESSIKETISQLYSKYTFLLNSDKIDIFDRDKFNDIIRKQCDLDTLAQSLKFLMGLLYKHYNKKVMLLIDEYDACIEQGFMENYYHDIIIFMNNLLCTTLKENEYLEKGLITGVMKIAKESLFSGLNNVKVYSLIDKKFNDKFGFTENEVSELFSINNLDSFLPEIKKWANGYICGGVPIYNPWTILNFIDSPDAGLVSYWINSGENALIKNILAKGSASVKQDLEILLNGSSVAKSLNYNIVFSDIYKDDDSLWSFLFSSGYLTYDNKKIVDGDVICDLKVPNKEVLRDFKRMVSYWFTETNMSTYLNMLQSLVVGDVDTFESYFKEYVSNNISYFDVSGTEPERVYHAFVLGMLVSLEDTHYVKSNKESGYGRYDVMLIPKNKSNLGIIFEFKKIPNLSDVDIELEADEALDQIENQNYAKELTTQGIANILNIAIVFKQKHVFVKTR